MRRMFRRLAQQVAAWPELVNNTIAKVEQRFGLPRMSNWRLLPYFLLLMLLFILYPLFLLIARIIIRRARNRTGFA